ncbi:hypothetical protein MIR68_008853 [Amoeboaphelidium protococcarum]|nr:hypothetical protein MIR68_008853 [Amoeboaphelidium protococcarum]
MKVLNQIEKSSTQSTQLKKKDQVQVNVFKLFKDSGNDVKKVRAVIEHFRSLPHVVSNDYLQVYTNELQLLRYLAYKKYISLLQLQDDVDSTVMEKILTEYCQSNTANIESWLLLSRHYQKQKMQALSIQCYNIAAMLTDDKDQLHQHGEFLSDVMPVDVGIVEHHNVKLDFTLPNSLSSLLESLIRLFEQNGNCRLILSVEVQDVMAIVDETIPEQQEDNPHEEGQSIRQSRRTLNRPNKRKQKLDDLLEHYYLSEALVESLQLSNEDIEKDLYFNVREYFYHIERSQHVTVSDAGSQKDQIQMAEWQGLLSQQSDILLSSEHLQSFTFIDGDKSILQVFLDTVRLLINQRTVLPHCDCVKVAEFVRQLSDRGIRLKLDDDKVLTWLSQAFLLVMIHFSSNDDVHLENDDIWLQVIGQFQSYLCHIFKRYLESGDQRLACVYYWLAYKMASQVYPTQVSWHSELIQKCKLAFQSLNASVEFILLREIISVDSLMQMEKLTVLKAEMSAALHSYKVLKVFDGFCKMFELSMLECRDDDIHQVLNQLDFYDEAIGIFQLFEQKYAKDSLVEKHTRIVWRFMQFLLDKVVNSVYNSKMLVSLSFIWYCAAQLCKQKEHLVQLQDWQRNVMMRVFILTFEFTIHFKELKRYLDLAYGELSYTKLSATFETLTLDTRRESEQVLALYGCVYGWRMVHSCQFNRQCDDNERELSFLVEHHAECGQVGICQFNFDLLKRLIELSLKQIQIQQQSSAEFRKVQWLIIEVSQCCQCAYGLNCKTICYDILPHTSSLKKDLMPAKRVLSASEVGQVYDIALQPWFKAKGHLSPINYWISILENITGIIEEDVGSLLQQDQLYLMNKTIVENTISSPVDMLNDLVLVVNFRLQPCEHILNRNQTLPPALRRIYKDLVIMLLTYRDSFPPTEKQYDDFNEKLIKVAHNHLCLNPFDFAVWYILGSACFNQLTDTDDLDEIKRLNSVLYKCFQCYRYSVSCAIQSASTSQADLIKTICALSELGHVAYDLASGVRGDQLVQDSLRGQNEFYLARLEVFKDGAGLGDFSDQQQIIKQRMLSFAAFCFTECITLIKDVRVTNFADLKHFRIQEPWEWSFMLAKCSRKLGRPVVVIDKFYARCNRQCQLQPSENSLSLSQLRLSFVDYGFNDCPVLHTNYCKLIDVVGDEYTLPKAYASYSYIKWLAKLLLFDALKNSVLVLNLSEKQSVDFDGDIDVLQLPFQEDVILNIQMAILRVCFLFQSHIAVYPDYYPSRYSFASFLLRLANCSMAPNIFENTKQLYAFAYQYMSPLYNSKSGQIYLKHLPYEKPFADVRNLSKYTSLFIDLASKQLDIEVLISLCKSINSKDYWHSDQLLSNCLVPVINHFYEQFINLFIGIPKWWQFAMNLTRIQFTKTNVAAEQFIMISLMPLYQLCSDNNSELFWSPLPDDAMLCESRRIDLVDDGVNIGDLLTLYKNVADIVKRCSNEVQKSLSNGQSLILEQSISKLDDICVNLYSYLYVRYGLLNGILVDKVSVMDDFDVSQSAQSQVKRADMHLEAVLKRLLKSLRRIIQGQKTVHFNLHVPVEELCQRLNIVLLNDADDVVTENVVEKQMILGRATALIRAMKSKCKKIKQTADEPDDVRDTDDKIDAAAQQDFNPIQQEKIDAGSVSQNLDDNAMVVESAPTVSLPAVIEVEDSSMEVDSTQDVIPDSQPDITNM